MRRRWPRVLVGCVLAAWPARAQWDPAAGQWGKSEARDLRVVSFNVGDALCSSASKTESGGNWEAAARLVAALRPDVLLLQETADNAGNGTGSGSDSVAALTSTLELFVRGGTDPFKPGQPAVTAYVRKYAPDFDLPHVFAGFESDGFNRNALLSRHPFADLDGDGQPLRGDMPTLAAHLWAPGGDGGIRGWQLAEIDLPDADYGGELLVGNSHLKAGSGAADHEQRVKAAQNMAYFIDHALNGGGLGAPDPFGKLADSPPIGKLLGSDDLFVTGGDWNEDEVQNGAIKGPADWIAHAASDGSLDDGPDRDRSDMLYDDARDVFTGSPSTQFSIKRDYLAWQDAIATERRSFVFNTFTLPAGAAPPELAGWPGAVGGLSAVASDHKPVVVDLVLPPPACEDAPDLGSATTGASGLSPRATACLHELAEESAVSFALRDAAANAPSFVSVSLSAGALPAFGGVLVPVPPLVFGRFATDALGRVDLGPVRGGGGPFTLFLQWVVVEPGGKVLSNALAVPWPR